LTVQELIKELKENNGITSVAVPAHTTLKIPPLPVRANGEYGFGRALRVFNAETHGYAVKQNAEVVKLTEAPTVGDAKSTEVKRVRAASATGIVIPATPENTALLISNALPKAVSAFSAVPAGGAPAVAAGAPANVVIGMVSVELLQDGDTGCPPVSEIIDRSLFRDLQKERVQRVLATRGQQVAQAAGDLRLVLLDVGFNGRHGSKVRQAAEQVLGQLGAQDLAGKLLAIDLYPVDARAQAQLEKTLKEYADSGQVTGTEFERKVKDAQAWIQASAQSASLTGPRLDIPEVLMQAVFWKYVRSRSVLNMSFRMKAPMLAVLLAQFSEGLNSLAVSAVGNTVSNIAPGWVPQDAIQARPSFVNVTYGTEKGEVRAEYAEGDTGARVSLVAPGCGFDGITETGASLASPYVAAASWVRALLDQVELNRTFDPKSFWRELLGAIRPAPLTQSVESGGIFDAAMLVAPPESKHYVVRYDKTVAPLSSLLIEYSCDLPGGGIRMPPIFGVPPAFQNDITSVAIYATEDGRAHLWKRTVPLTSFGRGTVTHCDLSDFRFEGTTPTGEITYDYRKIDNFRREVALVTW
jgi:hypothetical protein